MTPFCQIQVLPCHASEKQSQAACGQLCKRYLNTPWNTSAKSSWERRRCAASCSTSGVAGANANFPISTRLPAMTLIQSSSISGPPEPFKSVGSHCNCREEGEHLWRRLSGAHRAHSTQSCAWLLAAAPGCWDLIAPLSAAPCGAARTHPASAPVSACTHTRHILKRSPYEVDLCGADCTHMQVRS